MATLDYHPNEVARSLKVNRTFTIGMVVPDVSNLFFNDIFRGVETKARRHGFSVVLCDSHEDPVQERELLTMLVRRRVDGILLASAQASLAESRLAGRRPPTVCLDRVPGGFKGGVVVVDNVLASYQAARHLIELGHERIAIIAGPQTTLTGSGRSGGLPQGASGSTSSAARGVHSTWRFLHGARISCGVGALSASEPAHGCLCLQQPNDRGLNACSQGSRPRVSPGRKRRRL